MPSTFTVFMASVPPRNVEKTKQNKNDHWLHKTIDYALWGYCAVSLKNMEFTQQMKKKRKKKKLKSKFQTVRINSMPE